MSEKLIDYAKKGDLAGVQKCIEESTGGYVQKSNWLEVFSACLGKVMLNQIKCGELVVKEQDWNVDLSEGIILFGTDKYPIQFIGNESDSEGTWLWGWKNINGFSQNIIELAEQMKCLGGSLGLEELTTEELEITETLNGHVLAIVACGLSDKDICYYRGPHQNGAILVAFSSIDPKVFSEINSETFISVVMSSIKAFKVNHKIFIESFLYQNNTLFEWQENFIIAHFEKDLKIEFECVDNNNWRIINLTY